MCSLILLYPLSEASVGYNLHILKQTTVKWTSLFSQTGEGNNYGE